MGKIHPFILETIHVCSLYMFIKHLYITMEGMWLYTTQCGQWSTELPGSLLQTEVISIVYIWFLSTSWLSWDEHSLPHAPAAMSVYLTPGQMDPADFGFKPWNWESSRISLPLKWFLSGICHGSKISQTQKTDNDESSRVIVAILTMCWRPGRA